jgi:non-specific serine/threonine protein kinase
MKDKVSSGELIAVLMPDGSLQLEWGEAAGKRDKSSVLLQREIFTSYGSERQGWLLFLGFSDPAVALSPSLDFWRRFSGLFVHHLRMTPDLEGLRHLVQVPLAEQELSALLEVVPAMTGGEYLSAELLASFWSELTATFAAAIQDFSGSVADFIHRFSPDSHLLGRIYFHLVENKGADEPFAFLATYSTRQGAEGQSKHLPLKYALQEYRDDNAKLLELLVTVHEVARQSELIAGLLESNELFSPLAWNSEAAYTFLQEVPLYEEAGILCRIPDWWKAQGVSVSLKISLGEQAPALVGMAALLDFTPRLMLGEEEVAVDEVRRLLAEVEGLAFIKNKWVTVDRKRLEQTLAAYEEAQQLADREGLTLSEAMRLQLQPRAGLLKTADAAVLEVKNGQWLQSVFAKLSNPGLLPKVKTDDHFKARLRPYQQDGLRWLCGLQGLGFGCCLADDMGLGKTVQVLAFLNILAGSRPTAQKSAASLLIIPASLLANWDQEIQRFWPEMKVLLAHPSMHKPHKVPTPSEEALDGLDLVITTYALAQRYDWLMEYQWQYVILDEAQAIKNPGTKQTRAVKKIPAVNRIAMTGTPVENRLSDLWSLFDFVNPGLLGTSKEFAAFSKGLADHPDGYGRLRRMISPFILRRLKSDKSIINDLPDKVEMKTWAALSRKQAVVYQQLVDNITRMLETTEGIERKGVILAALTKFKQICNHPDQYAGVDGYHEKESGKFARLREICTTIYEKRERVLVFTQFKEMTEPLARFLERVFEQPGLIIHGSVPVAKRKKIIERFQSGDYIPFLVLSLKAGGVGLNLTRANHVIHFDRWWNPAVENQATDRAFRIGQQKKVMVHKFITKGTIEEKIDEMLTQKAKLSADLVAAGGEAWLTEMQNDELADLFSLTK